VKSSGKGLLVKRCGKELVVKSSGEGLVVKCSVHSLILKSVKDVGKLPEICLKYITKSNNFTC